MLDDMTPAELSDILGIPVVVGQPTLVDTFLHLENPKRTKPSRKPEFKLSL
jgi:hypothetical protein